MTAGLHEIRVSMSDESQLKKVRRMRVFQIKDLPNGSSLHTKLEVGDMILAVDGVAAPDQVLFDEAMAPRMFRNKTASIVVRRGEVELTFHVDRSTATGIKGETVAFDLDALARRTQEQQDAARRQHVEATRGVKCESLSVLFQAELHRPILINLTEPLKFETCDLVGAGADFIAVATEEETHVVPHASVLKVVASSGSAPMSVTIRHQVIYKGSTGIGVGVRIPGFPLE